MSFSSESELANRFGIKCCGGIVSDDETGQVYCYGCGAVFGQLQREPEPYNEPPFDDFDIPTREA